MWRRGRRVFDAFTFAFVPTDAGWIWCHAYGFDGRTSTFIVECSPETWTGLGFDTLGEADRISLLEKVFAQHLDGHPLKSQARSQAGAPWLNFRTVTNKRWHAYNIVLMGDAAHTTHFTIGSGTRLALEDAISLAAKLQGGASIAVALEQYGRGRRTALLLPQSAARLSARWFESVPRYIDLEPAQVFALLTGRRSPLLPRVPPRTYYRLYRATQRNAALRKLRNWVAPALKALYSRVSRGAM